MWHQPWTRQHLKVNRIYTTCFVATVASFSCGSLAAQEKVPAAPQKMAPYQQALKKAGNVPLLLLDATQKVWSLQVTGGARLSVKKGNVMVNSSHSGALWAADGTIDVAEGAIGVVGGVNRMGKPTINPEPRTGFKVMADPFPAFDAPASERVISTKKLFLNNQKDVTLSPGTYVDGIFATGNDWRLTFEPGTYYITGGDFFISGATVQGEGVTIVMLPNGAKEAGCFSTNFGTRINLSAPTDGPLQGLVILSAAKGFRKIAMSDTQGTLKGTIYGPLAEMAVSGAKTNVVVARVVCSSLGLTLSGSLEITGEDIPAAPPEGAATVEKPADIK